MAGLVLGSAGRLRGAVVGAFRSLRDVAQAFPLGARSESAAESEALGGSGVRAVPDFRSVGELSRLAAEAGEHELPLAAGDDAGPDDCATLKFRISFSLCR